MKQFIKKIRSVPWWGWVLGVVYFCLQYGIYRLGAWLSTVTGTVAWAFECKIPPIDDLIPIVPAFSVIYLYSYVFWIFGPIAASLTKKRNFVNYITGLSLAYVVGFLFFVFLPTYMDRVKEGLMAFDGSSGLFHRLLAMIYAADGSERAFNLFPSYHCLISLYCYLGVRKQPEISLGFRIYSLVMTVLICLSTVLTKQHYIIDVAGGLAIALLCWRLMGRLDPGRKYAVDSEKC
ncbi:MAG: phosphatase PAP2 family protein [Oscillospiraceae bacterium]|nr:phosphatase PAP2 family protein [Oscillospiraceae bacterium]